MIKFIKRNILRIVCTIFVSMLITLSLSSIVKAANTYDSDITYLTKTLYGEARGIKCKNGVYLDKKHQAAVVWCILNRVDDGQGTIQQVITAKNQFTGYSSSHPVWPELKKIAIDVYDRWQKEKNGETDVGRVLPAEYKYFNGRNGLNVFRKEYKSTTYWDWSLPDPYSN